MNTIAINYENESTREKIVLFLKNFLSEDVEICDLQNIKDLILIEEAKKERLPNIKFEDVLKESAL
ncbi:MAG: hypothetical protein HXX81_06800 [Campylobacterales bacterium]|nr:hypothetical protein [Campylobacterales bacterium]